MMEAEGGGTVEEVTHSNEKELGDQCLNQPEGINNVEMKEENLPQDDPKAAAPNAVVETPLQKWGGAENNWGIIKKLLRKSKLRFEDAKKL